MFFDFVDRLYLCFIVLFRRKINSLGARLMSSIFTRHLFAFIVAVLLISVPSSAFAGPVLPMGGSFAAGSGTISSSGSSMAINQGTGKAIINWNGFSIGQGCSVFFNNGQGATLNRVTGSSISSIAGLLKSSGSLYLINPNGIVITSTGSVITGGDFIASTLNESDSDFLSGTVSLSGTTGSVINEGSISSSGNAILVGTMVSNTGSITSSGNAALVSSTRLVLIPGSGLSSILISPSSISGSVTNSGVIKAASVYLSSAGGDVYALAGNNDGLIEATGVQNINGQVWLTAPQGSVTVSSPVKSSGNIFIDGFLNTELTSTSNLYSNGGDIKIGLFPSLPESLVTNLSSGSSIIDTNGNVETSGNTLNMGDITVKAQNWLLDPTDFTIDASNNAAIDEDLNSGTNVTITTTSGSTSAATPLGLQSGDNANSNGDINVDAPISWGSNAALTLSAYDNINVNSDITVSGNGGLVLDYNTGNVNGILNIPLDRSGFAAGIKFTGIYTGGLPEGSLTINGNVYTLVNASNIDNIDAMGDSGDYALATDITLLTPASGSNTNFIPIGGTGGFTGDFNGIGNTVDGLILGTPSSPSTLRYTGLFGSVLWGGTVENVGVTNLNINDGSYDSNNGGMVGCNGGTVFNSYSTGKISVGNYYYSNNNTIGNQANTAFIGGLVGYNELGNISVSYSAVSVAYNSTANAGESVYIGGLTGYSYYGNILDTYSTGPVADVNDYGDSFAGGLAGANGGLNIIDSYSTGSVTNTDNAGIAYVGGLVGGNNMGPGVETLSSKISGSYSTGSVNNTDNAGYNSVGGLVGRNAGIIYDSYSTGSVNNKDNGTHGNDNVGGLVGWNDIIAVYASIDGSYSTASVTNTTGSSSIDNDFVGGLVGLNNDLIFASYFSGTVINTDDGSSGSDSVGGLVGYNVGANILDSYSTGSVNNKDDGMHGNDSVGGLVGYNISSIFDSYSTGYVSNIDDTAGDFVGGLVGYNSGTISNSYSTSTVSGSDSAYNGGFAGINTGAISNSYSTGNVNGGTGSDVGGFVGYNYDFGNISNSYSTGSVTGGSDSDVGGFVGDNGGTVSTSYSTGSASGGTNSIAGGFVGDNDGTILNSYSTGSASGGTGSDVGGFVGYSYGGTVSNSYATGSVTGGTDNGGFVGENGGGAYTYDYWDTTTSGTPTGASTGSQTGFIGLTDAQMKQTSSFSGWNITVDPKVSALWFQYDDYTYPLLSSFMSPLTVNVTANSGTTAYNGEAYSEGAALSSPASYDSSNVNIGNQTYDIHDDTTGSTVNSAIDAGTYTFTPNAEGLYSNQSGYIISYGTMTSGTVNITNTSSDSPANVLSVPTLSNALDIASSSSDSALMNNMDNSVSTIDYSDLNSGNSLLSLRHVTMTDKMDDDTDVSTGLSSLGFDSYGINSFGTDSLGYSGLGFTSGSGYSSFGVNNPGLSSNASVTGYNFYGTNTGLSSLGFDSYGINSFGTDSSGYDSSGYDSIVDSGFSGYNPDYYDNLVSKNSLENFGINTGIYNYKDVEDILGGYSESPSSITTLNSAYQYEQDNYISDYVENVNAFGPNNMAVNEMNEINSEMLGQLYNTYNNISPSYLSLSENNVNNDNNQVSGVSQGFMKGCLGAMNESYKTFNDYYEPVNFAAQNYYDSTYNSKNYNPGSSASEYGYNNAAGALGFVTCGGIFPGDGSSNDTTIIPEQSNIDNYESDYDNDFEFEGANIGDPLFGE